MEFLHKMKTETQIKIKTTTTTKIRNLIFENGDSKI